MTDYRRMTLLGWVVAIVLLGFSPNATAQAVFTNCTMVGHKASDFVVVARAGETPFSMVNSILTGGQNHLGGALVAHSCVQGGHPGIGNISADPLFVHPWDGDWGDFALRSNSPCIDAGQAGDEWEDACLPPGQRTPRNDIGVTGGPYNCQPLQTVVAQGPRLIAVAPDQTLPLDYGSALFQFDFSVTMDTRQPLGVSYADGSNAEAGVLSASPGWVSPYRWQAALTVDDNLADGVYRVLVPSASAMVGLSSPSDQSHLFRVAKQVPDDLTGGDVIEETVNSLLLEWELTNRPGVVAQYIGRSLHPDGPYQLVATVGPTVTRYLDIGLDPETVYYYRVYVRLSGKTGIPADAVATRTFMGTTSQRPFNVSLEPLSPTRLRLRWVGNVPLDASGKVVLYRGYREDMPVAELPLSATEYIFSDLLPDQELVCRVTQFFDDQKAQPDAAVLSNRTLPCDINSDGDVDSRDINLLLGMPWDTVALWEYSRLWYHHAE